MDKALKIIPEFDSEFIHPKLINKIPFFSYLNLLGTFTKIQNKS